MTVQYTGVVNTTSDSPPVLMTSLKQTSNKRGNGIDKATGGVTEYNKNNKMYGGFLLEWEGIAAEEEKAENSIQFGMSTKHVNQLYNQGGRGMEVVGEGEANEMNREKDGILGERKKEEEVENEIFSEMFSGKFQISWKRLEFCDEAERGLKLGQGKEIPSLA